MADLETAAKTKSTFAEGAAPGTPSAATVIAYAKADGLMYSKDDAGTETLMSSGIALSNPMTTAGDIIKGGAAGVAERLAIGASRTLLKSNGTTPGYAFPTAIGCIIAEATAQSVNDSTNAFLTSNDAEILDTDSFHDTSSNTSRITIPSGLDGKYRCTGTAFFAADGDGYRGVFFGVGGVLTERGYNRVPSAGAGAGTYVTTTVDLLLVATNYVEFGVNHTAGAALNVTMMSFAVIYLGV